MLLPGHPCSVSNRSHHRIETPARDWALGKPRTGKVATALHAANRRVWPGVNSLTVENAQQILVCSHDSSLDRVEPLPSDCTFKLSDRRCGHRPCAWPIASAWTGLERRCCQRDPSPAGVRDTAIWRLLYGLGLRRSEPLSARLLPTADRERGDRTEFDDPSL